MKHIRAWMALALALLLMATAITPALAEGETAEPTPPIETPAAEGVFEIAETPTPAGVGGKALNLSFALRYRTGVHTFTTSDKDSAGLYTILGELDYLEITPLIDDPSLYPFSIDTANPAVIMIKDGAMQATDGKYNRSFTVRSDILNGTHSVYFNLLYSEKGSDEVKSAQVRLFIRVSGAISTDPTPTPGVERPSSTPKLIIKSFATDPQEIMAGSEFDLNLELHNTSAKRRVNNIKATLRYDGEDGMIAPISGSSSFYIDTIGADKVHSQTIRMKARADAPEKVHTMTLTLEYEDPSANAISTAETLAFPVLQERRLFLDTVNVPPEGSLMGNSFTLMMDMRNMGKAVLYNVTAVCEGDALMPYGTFFAGNMDPGAQRSMELEVEPTMPGALEGIVRVTYEDASGKLYEADPAAFTIFVEEPFIPEPEYPDKGEDLPGMGEDLQPAGGASIWVWVLIAAAAILLITAAVLIARKRRKRVEQEYEMD